MNHNLNDQERRRLDRRIAEAEKRTGAQIVLAVIERSDSYAELPWKAFAAGAVIAGPSVTVQNLLKPGGPSAIAVLLAIAVTLAAGALCALVCVMAPRIARLFLDAHRAEMETRQYAESLFLSRELFATRGRTGILLLVSLFERKVVVLPDKGIRKRLTDNGLQGVIDRMVPPLALGRIVVAMENGLDALEEVLLPSAPKTADENELPDEIVDEEGK